MQIENKRQIENEESKLTIFLNKLNISPSLAFKVFSLLYGKHSSWVEIDDSNTLQLLPIPPCNCLKSTENRLFANKMAFSVACSRIMDPNICKELMQEFSALLLLKKFFEDSPN